MLRGTVVFILILVAFHCFGQVEPTGSIRVKVIDASTEQPLPYINVFLSRTTIGGYTNEQGEIDVKKIPFGSYELIFSSVSYKPLQRKLIVRSEQTVHMTVKLLVRMLDVVQVNAKKDDKWARQLSRFEKLFFGNEHLKQCKITNPWVLDFKTVQGTFIAEAAEPLKIENNFLGYDLSFEIKTCAFNNDKFKIIGNTKFDEKLTTDSTLAHTWRENREKVYRGSLQHFLRSAINNTITTDGYEIYSDVTSDNDIIRGANFLRNVGASIMPATFQGRVSQSASAGMYDITFPSRLEVHYRRKRAPLTVYRNVGHAITWLEVKGSTLSVSKDGVVQNPDNLTLLGNMSNMKVVEWLPLDYKYSKEKPAEPEVPIMATNDVLLEKPYVQTDRGYYYNREVIWLKGYMNYYVPILRDTLSRSVYVDLVDRSGKTVLTKVYPVTNGMFSGDIAIDRSLTPGLYQLKAYTRWMLNFDPEFIFTKTISILGEKEAVRVVTDHKYINDTTGNVTIGANRESYAARDLITLTIDVKDSLEFATAADLSISVTDIEQAIPADDEKIIMKSFLFSDRAVADLPANVKYDIQYGIDFKGTFLLRNKRDQGIITVYGDKANQSFAMISDTLGRFSQTLSFVDSAKFYVDAVSVNKKRGRVVMDSTKHLPAPLLTFDSLKLDVYTSENSRRDRGLNLNAATVLKEVEIKSTKIEQQKTTPDVIHPKGDYEVIGDWIKQNNIMDVTTALGRKVPGMAAGLAAKKIRLGPISTGGDASPLIVIDGIAQPSSDVDALNDIPIRSIDRIEVLKFGSAASYGSRGANGVIAIYTKKGSTNSAESSEFDKTKLQPVTIPGYSPTIVFAAPDYGKPVDNDYFDYRATIFWKPDVSTNGNSPAIISFYAADAATKYRVVVEGVTSSGVPVRGEKIITITSGK